MKLGVMIDTILIRVSGGRISTDVSVYRADIRAYLPAAINFAASQSYWLNAEREGDHEIPGSFLSEYEDIPVKKDSKDRLYIDAPDGIVDLGGNRGIRFVTDDCENEYSPAPQGSLSGFDCYWGKALSEERYYQLRSKKIYLKNHPDAVATLNVGAYTGMTGIGDNDEVPVPAEQEPVVIDVAVAFFKDQRFTPKDYIINGRDLPIQ